MIHRCLFALVAWTCCLTAPLNAQQIVRFDFGPQSAKTDGDWNQVTSPSTTGIAVRDAVDTSGRATSVVLNQLDGWSGFNTAGHEADEPYPADAMRDSFYLEEGKDDQAVLQLEGLTPGAKYTLTFFASRMGGTDLRTAVYRASEQECRLNAFDNTRRSVQLSNLRADGRGRLTIKIARDAGQQIAYLGVLEVSGSFKAAGEIRQPADSLDGPPFVSAKGWAVADGRTGRILWSDQEDVSRPMASTTKMMTAWIVLELAAEQPELLDEMTTISMRADRTSGSTAGVRDGERIAIKDLLYGLLLPSGNDAAVALAEHFGSRFELPEDAKSEQEDGQNQQADDPLARFVAEMNRRAESLGMSKTRYFDPHGNSANRASPRDLLRLAWTALQNKRFAQYVSMRYHRCNIEQPDGSQRDARWRNTNQLLGIEGYDGVKTGTTTSAGACLVSSGRRGEDHLLVVVLGATSREGRYIDSRNLYRWAWKQRGQTEGGGLSAEGGEPAGRGN